MKKLSCTTWKSASVVHMSGTKLTEDEVDSILDTIGRDIVLNEDWARVAMGCLDQAMLTITVQDEIAAILRREGVEVET